MATRVEMSVRNGSTLHFSSVVVTFPDDGAVNYGALAPDASSDAREVSTAYRYAPIRALADGHEYVFQPIDYVGEKKLTPGRYQYVLRLQDGQLFVELGSQ